MEDSWTTMGLQRSMKALTASMSESFEEVFARSEDIKQMMQGVYNTFIAKFGFEKMVLPSLDLDPHRTKLKLLVHETEAFARDPINVAHYKGPLVKKFYGTLVKQARQTFTDAKTQAERWIQAVTLPLEIQIKDHKAQLQSRLDNLAKINEKQTTINEQMAVLKNEEAELKKQRDMIEGLILRVSQHQARADLQADIPPATHAPDDQPIEFMKTVVLDAAPNVAPARPAPAAAPQPRPAPAPAAQPMVSDDLLAEIAGTKPAFDPMKTQKLGADGDRTQKVRPLDPNYRPDATQKLDPARMEETQILDAKRMEETQVLDAKKMETTAILDGLPASDAEVTQRLDDSIWRLQEARRILQKLPKT
jgi:hypothetical protein